MKKNLRTILAALLALTLILSATAALANTAAPDGAKCTHCGSTKTVYVYTDEVNGSVYFCYGCGLSFFIKGSRYISIPTSGEGEGNITFVSTRRCVVTLNGVKEYFNFRVEDGKLILTNADGVETEVTVGEDGKGTLEITLSNGETVTVAFPSTTLSGIVNNGVFPIEKQEEPM
ncbi:MAG: hypothetical protein IJQ62_14055 [Clostridia bacterium]|nr:hypothetical protein [Clostridia bacterium]